MEHMYHTKRRYSAINKILKSCKRVIYQSTAFLQKKAHRSTSITGKILANTYAAIYDKLQSLGIKGTCKIIVSIMSIFLFAGLVMSVSDDKDIAIFADNSLNIKEVDDAYISLDGAILDEDEDFGARFIYIVKPGDTLDTIAREFGVTVTSLSSSNRLQSTMIKPGQELVISNVDGFIYTTTEQITIRDFALKYRLDLQDLKELNSLQNDNDTLALGDDIFVPLTMDEGKKLGLILPDPEPEIAVEPNKPAIVKPSKKTKAATKTTTKTTTKAAGGVWRVNQTRAACFGFVPGQCTCYAAQKRPDIFVPGKSSPWRGNAKQRYNNAKAAGYSVGTQASIGAIAVMPQGRGNYGHVGIVVDIDGDSILLESMNYVGPYIVNRVRVDASRIRGYIY